MLVLLILAHPESSIPNREIEMIVAFSKFSGLFVWAGAVVLLSATIFSKEVVSGFHIARKRLYADRRWPTNLVP